MQQIGQIASFLAVFIVFVLILYASYICSKKVAKISLRENQSKYMKLVDRIVVGQDKHVSIVSIGGRYFLIGTSANSITMLTELDQENLIESEIPETSFPGAESFKEIFKKLGRDKETKI